MAAKEGVSYKAKWDGVCPMNVASRMVAGASAVAA